MLESRPGGRPEERPGSGNDANAKVFLQLLEEDEGEHSVWNQADTCRDETLEGRETGDNKHVGGRFPEETSAEQRTRDTVRTYEHTNTILRKDQS